MPVLDPATAKANPCMRDDRTIEHTYGNPQPCGTEMACQVCERVLVSPHDWTPPKGKKRVMECKRCGSRRVAPPKEKAERSPLLDIKGPIRFAGYVREVPGYRVLVVEIPADVMRAHLVEHHEPDVKQIAESHMMNALLGDADWAEGGRG